MKRILIAITLLIIILITVETPLASNIQIIPISSSKKDGNIIIVDKNGDGNYLTIQSAIEKATEGSIIYVNSGTYSEIISITKKITIIGENRYTTIINPISEENKYAIQIRSVEVTIKNLSITNRGSGIYTSGIYILASGVAIDNCNFYKNPIGIIIWTSNNIISNCNFWECSDEGIALIGTLYSQCENNQIINCNFYDNCDGIELQYSSNNIIRDCQFYSNSHTGIDAITSSNNKNIISNCNIYDNEVHGIYLSASSENQIINCYISNNKNGNIIERKNCYNNEIKISNEYINKIRLFLNQILTILMRRFAYKFSNIEFYSKFTNFINLNF